MKKEPKIHLVVRESEDSGLSFQVPWSLENLARVCDFANELIDCTRRHVDVLRDDPMKPNELLLLTKEFDYPLSHEGPHEDDMEQRPRFDVGPTASGDGQYVSGRWLTELESATVTPKFQEFPLTREGG